MMKATFKNVLSFEFWQKFGKALMVVIAVMPAAGLMISIGKSLAMIDPNLAPLVITGGVLEQIGWGVIGNLHILFALAIGGSWAKERAGGAFAAGLAFILINRITGTIFGVSGDMLKNPDAMVTTFFGGSIKVADYFISVLEAPALNMGVFVGIISGFVGATAYNKYYNYRKLPDALSFFNGKRFVPFVVILRSAIAAIPEVREKLVSLQQEIAQQGGIVMDGRDIGTVVLPQAELKIFLVASVDERAERRYKENIAKGIETDLETLKEEIAARDYKDSHRETSPLKQAEDAVYLDTTGLNIQEVVEKIKAEAKKRM